jgi:C1A family cysteine protease
MLLPLDHFKKRRQNAQFIRKMNPELVRALTDSSDEGAAEYPSHFDWRDKGVVTPVKAQGNKVVEILCQMGID